MKCEFQYLILDLECWNWKVVLYYWSNEDVLLGESLEIQASCKVRVWRTFDKNGANVNSKASISISESKQSLDWRAAILERVVFRQRFCITWGNFTTFSKVFVLQ